MAVLPGGEYGISSASTVASHMLSSFPNIRIGLMVGVGGGVPSQKHDIRLGDIVVSAPRDGKGGVLQYDFGKTIQGQSFQHTGFLNQPPMVLRTAMSGLETQYKSDGHQLKDAISGVFEKKPRLRKTYERPDRSSDRLYRSEVAHDGDASCAMSCGDDPLRLVLRSDRTEEEDDPAIHYGLIASASQLIKDASVRDKLAEEKEVLCFEMEAAGLMNHFPCLVIRGICDYSDSHKNKEWQGYAAMAAAAYTKDLLYRIAPNKIEAEKKIGDILSSVHEHLAAVTSRLDRRPEQKGPQAVYLVPNRQVPKFIGRKDILKKIHASFSSGSRLHRVVLCGLGGQGKTQIALEYCCWTRKKRFQSIFWVEANSESTVKKSFATIAQKIKAPDENVSDEVAISYVLDKIGEWPDPWLMIFDNYDDVVNFENIQDFIPNGEDGRILITSRHSDSMYLATDAESAIDLLGLVEPEALELLFELSGEKETEALIPHCQTIVQRLACHPLAIAQAGSYIKSRKIPLHQFIDEFNRRKKQILEHTPQLTQYRRRLDDSERETSLNVFTTWELSFEQLLCSSSGQNQSSLLTLFAFFDGKDISEQLFSTYCEEAQRAPKHYLWPVPYFVIYLNDESKWSPDEFCDSLVNLTSLSLLQSWSRGEDDFCHCSLHPLVQDWIRLRTKPEDFQHSVCIAAKVLEATLYKSWRDGDSDLELAVRQSLMSHTSMYIENKRIVDVIVDRLPASWARELNARNPILRRIKKRLRAYLRRTITTFPVRMHQGSRRLRAKTEEQGEQASFLLDKRFFDTEDIIAMFLNNTGQYDEAIAIQSRLVQRAETVLGHENYSTLIYKHNLAGSYLDQGKLELAEQMYRQVLESQERTLSPDHPDTLFSIHNLANTLSNSGNYEAAENMIRRALVKREELFGLEHRDTLISLRLLAEILERQDKFEEAEPIARRVLEGYENLLGPEHIETLRSAKTLGSILFRQAMHDAESMTRRALDGIERKLGKEDPKTLGTLGDLGRILGDQGKVEAAEEMLLRALKGLEKVLGREDRDTLIVVWNLAVLGKRRKEYTRADALYQRACAGYQKTLGAEHPHTILCEKQYAELREKMEEETENASSSGGTTSSGSADEEDRNGSIGEGLGDD
ncbi:Nephrocystin-3 [Lachnellula cervina]|uniref:Nephrocystin-3 n=1 Tax=Lachnellula cervina TaxID=1316786 RepID=A0A7D8UMJ9_9HELO|nr:Nephrocystin-3 [Lachnellula cervina]